MFFVKLKMFGDEQRLALPGSGEQGELLGWERQAICTRESRDGSARHGRLIMHTGEKLSSSVQPTHSSQLTL